LLSNYCEKVQKETTSLAPNRIVASTLFRFAGIKAFVDHEVAIDFRDMTTFFSDEGCATEVGWQLRWQPAQDDGYLTRIRTMRTPT
jgi:hypothetical protein